MKNIIECKNCHEENPFYAKTCWKCHSYLRDKIYNIDLWKTIAGLTESPRDTFKTIILSEHKNFTIVILLITAIKFYIDSLFLSLFGNNLTGYHTGLLFSFGIILAGGILIITVFSLLLKLLTSSSDAKTRFKDNFAIFTYSLIPHGLGLCILFPIELALFGGYLFSSNPSPFAIKETLAYIMAGFELLVLLWSMFLSITALFVQTKNLALSLILSVIFNIVIFYTLYLVGIIN